MKKTIQKTSHSELPPLEYLEELFDVDFEKGHLFWKNRSIKRFSNESTFKTWNTRFSGKRAGTDYTNKYGYTRRAVRIDGKRFTEHHIIWYMFYRESVDKDLYQIDHIDRDATNNSINNLRLANRIENAANRVLKGYSWNAKRESWQVRFETNGKILLRARVKCEVLAKYLYAYMSCAYHGEFSNFFPFTFSEKITCYTGITKRVVNVLQDTLNFSPDVEFVEQITKAVCPELLRN